MNLRNNESLHLCPRNNANLYYICSGLSSSKDTVVFLPGLGGKMCDYLSVMRALPTYHTIVIGRRGMEGDSVPPDGYSFDDQTEDFTAVLNNLLMTRLTIVAHSASVPCALSIASSRRVAVDGLVLIDHIPVYPKLSDNWLSVTLSNNRIPEPVARGLHRESERVDLWNAMSSIDCPILIVRGGLSPFVSNADVHRYRDSGSNVAIVSFENSAHDVTTPFPSLFHGLLSSFVCGGLSNGS